MKGSPMQRNFGVASPNKKIDTETKYLDDKTNPPNPPKTPKMNKEVTQKKPPSAPRPMRTIELDGVRSHTTRQSPTDARYEYGNMNPLPNEGEWYDPQLKTPGPSIGAPKSKGEQRREARKAKRNK
jgi:hypothetical protein